MYKPASLANSREKPPRLTGWERGRCVWPSRTGKWQSAGPHPMPRTSPCPDLSLVGSSILAATPPSSSCYHPPYQWVSGGSGRRLAA